MSGCTPSLYITSLKNGILVHLKWHLFLFIFKFSWWQVCITCPGLLSWSLLSTSYPTMRMPYAMSNILGRPLKISSIFLWNMSPSGATPKGSLVNLYLLHSHADMKILYYILGWDTTNWHYLWSCSAHKSGVFAVMSLWLVHIKECLVCQNMPNHHTSTYCQ